VVRLLFGPRELELGETLLTLHPQRVSLPVTCRCGGLFDDGDQGSGISSGGIVLPPFGIET